VLSGIPVLAVYSGATVIVRYTDSLLKTAGIIYKNNTAPNRIQPVRCSELKEMNEMKEAGVPGRILNTSTLNTLSCLRCGSHLSVPLLWILYGTSVSRIYIFTNRSKCEFLFFALRHVYIDKII